jgi:hypothetical protein
LLPVFAKKHRFRFFAFIMLAILAFLMIGVITFINTGFDTGWANMNFGRPEALMQTPYSRLDVLP